MTLKNENETIAPANPWQRSRPPAGDAPTSVLFWLVVLGVGCSSLLTVAWGASALLSQKGSEKLLRIGQILPKLKNVHGERKASAFRMSEPEPSELAHPKDRTPPAAPKSPAVIDQPAVPLAAPVGMSLIPPLDLTPPPVETCLDPVVYLHPCSSPRGDSPMIRTWKTMTMYSLLSAAAVMLAPPPVVIANDKKDPPVEVKGLDDVVKALNELSKRIETLEKKKAPAIDQEGLTEAIRTEVKAAVKEINSKLSEAKLQHKLEIDKLTAEIDALQKKVAANTAAPTPALDKTFMEETRSSLKALQDAVAKIGPTEKRTMMASPLNGGAKLGRVMIVNLYHDDLLFLINGKDYVIPAGKSRLLDDIPVGTLQYRVHSARWGRLIEQSTTLAPGETFTLTAAQQR